MSSVSFDGRLFQNFILPYILRQSALPTNVQSFLPSQGYNPCCRLKQQKSLSYVLQGYLTVLTESQSSRNPVLPEYEILSIHLHARSYSVEYLPFCIQEIVLHLSFQQNRDPRSDLYPIYLSLYKQTDYTLLSSVPFGFIILPLVDYAEIYNLNSNIHFSVSPFNIRMSLSSGSFAISRRFPFKYSHVFLDAMLSGLHVMRTRDISCFLANENNNSQAWAA